MVSKYQSKVDGTENINGITCEKQVVTAQDKRIHSRWYSKELDFPVKLVLYRGEEAAYVTEVKAMGDGQKSRVNMAVTIRQ